MSYTDSWDVDWSPVLLKEDIKKVLIISKCKSEYEVKLNYSSFNVINPVQEKK